MLADSKIGSAAADSPEKAGPMTAITLSLMSLVAPLLAWAGLPWLSKGSTLTLTDGLVALYWLTASFSPSLMLIPSWAFAPVRAPKKPSLSVVPELAPPPLAVVALPPPLAVVLLLVLLLLLELHAAVLEFEHPATGVRLSFSSPLPADLREVLAAIVDALHTESSSEEEN